MNVHVFFAMDVGMLVIYYILVGVKMPVRPVAQCPPQPPDEVDQAKGNEGPCSDVAPEGFECLQPHDSNTQRNAHEAQQDRAT